MLHVREAAICPNKLTITGTRRGVTLALPCGLHTVLQACYVTTTNPCTTAAATAAVTSAITHARLHTPHCTGGQSQQ